MGRTKSLADELADLSNPAPEKDPEDDPFGGAAALLESEDDELDIQKPRRHAKENPLLLRGDFDVDMNAGVYSGARSSRQQLYVDGDSNTSEDADHTEGDFLDEARDVGTEGLEVQVGEEKDGGEDTEENGGDEEEEADDEGDSGGQVETFPSGGFSAQYNAQQEEDNHLQAALSERKAADMAKGKAVAAQQQLTAHFVEYRILLQQVLENANRMPLPSYLQVAAHSHPDVESEMSCLAQSISDTQDQFHELQSVMEISNSAITQQQPNHVHGKEEDPSTETNLVKTADAQWLRINSSWLAVQPFIDASVDRWHRKTMLGTGGAALRSKLKSLAQSPSQHVAAILAEPSKLLARVQLPLNSVQRIGEPDPEQKDAVIEIVHKLDPETFDDSEFYSTLLKEFLEGEAGDQGRSLGTCKTKRKRAVDTRASKGRKIRYDVHSKLVNFMTPEEQHMPGFVSQVFSNLFGRRSQNLS